MLKKQKNSIDSYIIIFFHRLSPINLKTTKLNKYIIQTTFSSKKISTSPQKNIANKINYLEQNKIFSFNKKNLIKKNKNFEIFFEIKNFEENSEKNVIGKCSFNINSIIFSDFMKFPPFWICFENLLSTSKNEILGFGLISAVFINKSEIEVLPYFWENLKKNIFLEKKNIPCYLKIDYEVFNFSFFFIEFLKKNQKIKLRAKFKGKQIETDFFENGKIFSKFSFPILKPIIDENILFLLINDENEEIGEFLLNLEKFFKIEHDAIFAINIFNKEKTDLILRINYQFEKKIENFEKIPFLEISKICEEKLEDLKNDLEDEEEFSLILDLNFLSNFDFLEEFIFFEIRWGEKNQEIQIFKENGNFLKIEKRLKITEKFIFTQESYDFLPEPIILVKNKNKEILFLTKLNIEKISIMRENNIILKPEFLKLEKFFLKKKKKSNIKKK